MNRAGYFVTIHAAKQMISREILLREMREVLADPDQTYPMADRYPNHEHRRMVQGGRLGVVVDDSTREVITVVFRSADEWRAHQEAQSCAQ